MYLDLVKMCGNTKRNLEICQKVIQIREQELKFIWTRELRTEAKRELQWWKTKEFHCKEHLDILTKKIKNYQESY